MSESSEPTPGAHPPTMAIVPSPSEHAVSVLTCHAPHRDPKKAGAPCGSPLGHAPGTYEFLTTAERLPEEPDGRAWLPCTRKTCGAWNVFRIVAVEPILALPPAVVPTLSAEERIQRRPLQQQVAIYALASGVSVTRTAEMVSVDRATLKRWKTDPEFLQLVLELRPAVRDASVQAAMAGFMEVLDKEAKRGIGTNHRWFLDRTVFAELRERVASAKGKGGATNVSVQVAQQQQVVQGAIAGVWEERKRAAG